MTARRRYRTRVELDYFSRSFPAGTLCIAATPRQIDRALGRLPTTQTGWPANAMRWAVHTGEYSWVRFPGDGSFKGGYLCRFVPTAHLEAIK